MTPPSERLSPHILQAVHNEQLSSLKPLNRIRLLGVTTICLMYGFLEYWLINPNWSGFLPLLLGYLAVSILVFMVSHTDLDTRGITALTIPFVDVPVVFLHQLHTLEVIDPRGTAGFALGIFGLLIVLAAVTMHARLVVGVLLMSIIMEIALMYVAGMENGALVAAAVVLALLAGAVVMLMDRVTDLIVVATEEHARVDSLSRFLAPAVIKEINEGDGRSLRGGERTITVMFADIRGFTTLSEQLSPEEVVALLNDYFTRMSTVIFRHGGTLDKFVGDGIMAYFGAPVAQDDQCDRAIRCAIEMQQVLKILNTERVERDDSPLRIGIGMHTGSAMVGIIGSDKRKEYTAVGDTVNVAARVEGLTKKHGRPLLVSAETLAGAQGDYTVDRVGDISIRGRVKSLEMFAICESEYDGEVLRDSGTRKNPSTPKRAPRRASHRGYMHRAVTGGRG